MSCVRLRTYLVIRKKSFKFFVKDLNNDLEQDQTTRYLLVTDLSWDGTGGPVQFGSDSRNLDFGVRAVWWVHTCIPNNVFLICIKLLYSLFTLDFRDEFLLSDLESPGATSISGCGKK